MSESSTRHLAAVAEALFVTFLWSTSWVLIKVGLEEVPPLLFAGLRYGLAALLLVPWVALSPTRRRAVIQLRRGDWAGLIALGVLLYTLTQGAQFVALATLPAVALSLALSCTPLVVAGLSVPLLGERPTRLQLLGALVFLAGAALYLDPTTLNLDRGLGGVIAAGVCLGANGAAALLGRHVNRRRPDALVVTTVSMGTGALLLLAVGIGLEGWPHLRLESWAIVAWLAVVNTAFAFTLWNRTLRHLSATESSVVNNTMLLQIAILAWIFLGERVTPVGALGLVVAGLGVLLVQLRR